jgi:very-short-patch-repair endonuclease
MRRHSDDQLGRARDERRQLTLAEMILWRSLRDRGIGAKFRRQVPIGPYIGDFVCIHAKVVVELDGPPHEKAEQRLHDARRDQWFRAKGWRVLRFPNDPVIGGSEAIIDEIRRAVAYAMTPPRSPA